MALHKIDDAVEHLLSRLADVFINLKIVAGVFIIVHFDRYAGNWLGPTVMAYGVGGLAALASGLLLVPRFGFFSWLAPLLVAVAAIVALSVLRPLKAWWIWLLWSSGLVFDDDTGAADRE